ncbi:MAG: LexA family transcriptional regulator, partial [Bacteroidales bacterium]|nr:LexA family transcriptional regulator [Bacteroidales bacterium]
MEKDLPVELQRFKQIREELNFTQADFAKILEISGSTSDIERGRTKLSGKTVMKLLEQFSINPLWLFGRSNKKYLNPDTVDVLPKMITVDDTGNENILMVNVKAAAGYPDNIRDEKWFNTLPAFSIPIEKFRNATFRSFQVEGNSMLPVFKPGEWVLAKAISSLEEINSGTVCVAVLQDSVLLKKVEISDNKEELKLISFNKEYPNIEIKATDLLELWKVSGKIAFDLEQDV